MDKNMVEPTTSWNHMVDMLIVGSGAASVCAALIARDNGLEPLIVEKLDVFGGTTAYSGGSFWIPDNPLMEREGVPDSFDRAMTYMDAAIWHDGPSASPERRRAFVRHAREAISYVEGKGMKLRRARYWPIRRKLNFRSRGWLRSTKRGPCI